MRVWGAIGILFLLSMPALAQQDRLPATYRFRLGGMLGITESDTEGNTASAFDENSNGAISKGFSVDYVFKRKLLRQDPDYPNRNAIEYLLTYRSINFKSDPEKNAYVSMPGLGFLVNIPYASKQSKLPNLFYAGASFSHTVNATENTPALSAFLGIQHKAFVGFRYDYFFSQSYALGSIEFGFNF